MQTTILFNDGDGLNAVQDLVAWAEELHLCYAWASSRGGRAPHWRVLAIEKVRRAVIGVHFAQTEPRVLQALADADVLRVVADARGVYHPKVMVGVRGDQLRALVGSSNFTAGGFPAGAGNVELNVLLEGERADEPLATLLTFVEGMWDDDRSFEPNQEWLDDYEEAYANRPPHPVVPPPPGTEEHEPSLEDLDVDWPDFVRLIERQELRALADGWEIHVFDFPESGSYLEEAESCQAAFQTYASFADMPASARRLIAGWGEETSGYFGRNVGAGYFKQMVNDEPEEIAEWLDLLPRVGPVDAETASTVLEGLIGLQGVALGVASRLMCVKRPDLFVVINNANDEAVRRIFGARPRAVSTYLQLMQTIRNLPWWSAPRPADAREARIWDARVALLDAVMYEIPAYQRTE